MISFKSTFKDPGKRMELVKPVSTCAAMLFMASNGRSSVAADPAPRTPAAAEGSPGFRDLPIFGISTKDEPDFLLTPDPKFDETRDPERRVLQKSSWCLPVAALPGVSILLQISIKAWFSMGSTQLAC